MFAGFIDNSPAGAEKMILSAPTACETSKKRFFQLLQGWEAPKK
jgi:hypothetical protein